jgi:hypothetical protein
MLGSALGLLGLGALPALALGESSVPPLPSVTTPTLPVPPVPVPTPTIPAPDVPAPDVPAPDVPVSPELPAAPASDAPSADSVTSGPVSSTGGSPSGDGASESSSGSRAPARGEGRGRVTSVETRPPRFKTRGDDHRGTTLRYRLTHAGLVRFTVFRLAPTCERVGSFLRTGQRGQNETRFSGRVDGRPLSPGTYRIEARPVGRGDAATESDRFVVVAPSESVASASAQPSTCAPSGNGSDATSTGDGDAAVLVGGRGSDDSSDRKSRSAGGDYARDEGGGEEGGVAQFRESSPGVVGGEDEFPLALVLAFAVAVGSLLAFLAWVGARDLKGRLRSQ